MVGSGLAGASAAATMAQLGYKVKVFTYHDSPRRAHSIAAQGGINAAKNYHGDGDSVYRLFYDTVKGGDFRSREANSYRLAQVSNNIIDQATAQGVPFAREYGGLLDNRSFGGAQVSRTFYARGQTGQQLLLGAYQALAEQIGKGTVELYNRTEFIDCVVVDGRAAGIVVRDLLTGEIRSHAAHAVVLATGGYGNVYYLSTNAMACNVSAAWRAHRRGALFANPCYTQIHPTCIPSSDEFQSKLTLMSESLRNDGRIWVPVKAGDTRRPDQIPEAERDYYLERKYPSFGNLVPRDVASRNAKTMVDEGKGVGPLHNGVYLDFAGCHQASRTGRHRGPLREPLRDVRAHHRREPLRDADAGVPGHPLHDGRPLGGLRAADHRPGPVLHRRVELQRPGRQPARRLGLDAGPRGRLLRAAVHHRQRARPAAQPPARRHRPPAFQAAEAEARDRFQGYLSIKGSRSVDWFHRELGKIMWEHAGMERSRPGLEKALSEIPALYEEFKTDLRVLGDDRSLNQSLERAGRVDDFFQLGQLLCRDALEREESCGGHFRSEHQTPEGEALRDDEHFSHVAAWEFTGDDTPGDPPHRAPRPSSTSTSRSGATSSHDDDRSRRRRSCTVACVSPRHHRPDVAGLAPGRAELARRLRGVRRPRHLGGDVVPRDARRRQRTARVREP